MQALRRTTGVGGRATTTTMAVAVAATTAASARRPLARTRTSSSTRAVASSSSLAAPPPPLAFAHTSAASSSLSYATYPGDAAPWRRGRRRHLAGRASATALPPGLGGGGGGEPTAVDPLPEGLRVEPDPDSGAREVTYDETTNTVKIPLKMMDADDGDGDGADPSSGRRGRRTKLVMFTCKPCGHRSARLVNPLAWEKGLVFGQCQNCGAWHTLASNNPNIYEEIRFDKADGSGGGGSAGSSSSSGASDQTAAAAGSGGAEADDAGSSPPI